MQHLFKLILVPLAVVSFAAACMNQIQTEVISSTPSATPSVTPSLSLRAVLPETTRIPIVASLTVTPTINPVLPKLLGPIYSNGADQLPTHMPIVQIPPSIPATVTPTSSPVVSAPVGLTYSYDHKQWIIGSDQKSKVVGLANASISPDGQWEIYAACGCSNYSILKNLATGLTRTFIYDGWSFPVWSLDSHYIFYTMMDNSKMADIWIEDVHTGNKHNLSNTPDRFEDNISLWPANPNVLFFYSTQGIPDGAGYIGIPTIMYIDGTQYSVISEQDVSSPADLSPDGKTIAYATYENSISSPRYFRLGEQSQPFPWKNFGLKQYPTMGFSSPSWSPDGNKIAWWMWSYDNNNQKNFGGVGFFDLEAGTAFLFDHFSQLVPDGWPSAVQWSPNGKMFAFYSDGERTNTQHTDAGIWIVDVDQKKVRQLVNLSDFCSIVWQPDSQWLAFSCYDSHFEHGIWLINVETTKLLKTDLPSTAELLNWIRAPK